MIDYTFTRIRKSESTSAIVSPSTMSMEIEETLRRISSHRGVKGVIICNSEGAPIRSNLPEDEEQTYSALISQLTSKANSVVRTLDEADELTERLKVNTGRNKVCAGLELRVSRLRRIRISPIALTPRGTSAST